MRLRQKGGDPLDAAQRMALARSLIEEGCTCPEVDFCASFETREIVLAHDDGCPLNPGHGHRAIFGETMLPARVEP